MYGKLHDDSGVNLTGHNRKEILSLLKLSSSRECCFFPEDYGYMVINILEGEIVACQP